MATDREAPQDTSTPGQHDAGAVLDGRSEILNRLPMVVWDRCVPHADGTLVVYGWVTRSDGARDFACMLFLWPDDPLLGTFVTSSAKHSAAMTAALWGEESEHVECVRVGDVFGDRLARLAGPAPLVQDTDTDTREALRELLEHAQASLRSQPDRLQPDVREAAKSIEVALNTLPRLAASPPQDMGGGEAAKLVAWLRTVFTDLRDHRIANVPVVAGAQVECIDRVLAGGTVDNDAPPPSPSPTGGEGDQVRAALARLHGSIAESEASLALRPLRSEGQPTAGKGDARRVLTELLAAEVQCPHCVGTGELESSDSTDDSWWDCRSCAGRGKRPLSDAHPDAASVIRARLDALAPAGGERRAPNIRARLRDAMLDAGVADEHIDGLLDLAAEHGRAALEAREGRAPREWAKPLGAAADRLRELREHDSDVELARDLEAVAGEIAEQLALNRSAGLRAIERLLQMAIDGGGKMQVVGGVPYGADWMTVEDALDHLRKLLPAAPVETGELPDCVCPPNTMLSRCPRHGSKHVPAAAPVEDREGRA